MFKHMIPAAIALVILVVGLVQHRKLTGTGDGIEILETFCKTIKNVPAEFGNWVSKEQPIPPDQFARTGCKEYISREYRNTVTGDVVSVYLVTGTNRHITIHTPDWCYQGAGFRMLGGVNDYEMPMPADSSGGSSNATAASDSAPPSGATPAKFNTAVFEKEDENGIQQLRIIWSYSHDGQWESAKLAKVKFAWQPALFKVYVIATNRSDVPMDQSPNVKFAKEFMPLLNEVLFEPEGTPSSPDNDTAVASR